MELNQMFSRWELHQYGLSDKHWFNRPLGATTYSTLIPTEHVNWNGGWMGRKYSWIVIKILSFTARIHD